MRRGGWRRSRRRGRNCGTDCVFLYFLVLGKGWGKGISSLVRYQSRVKVVYHCLSFWPSSHEPMSMLLRR